jgi:selenide,water dikinase
MTEGSGLTALISFEQVPIIIDGLRYYIDLQSVPGGTGRNWESYGEKIGPLDPHQKAILADPQTSGGLLVAVKPSAIEEVRDIFRQNALEQFLTPIGEMVQRREKLIYVKSFAPS